MTTTVNYNDVGLTAEQIAALKGGHRATGWRMKILKSTGVKLFDESTAVIEKIDDGTHFDPHTLGDKYIKMVKDERHNRTFILHKNVMDTASAIVSIINHDRETTDPKYIETINETNSAGWPTEFDGVTTYPLDIAYNPDLDQLAIAIPGVFDGVTFYGPGLIIIDTARYLPKLLLNYCATLEDNPNYLAATVLRADDTIQNGKDPYVKFVRYYHGEWFTWTRVDARDTTKILWQLGAFKATTGVFSLYFQYGWAPESTDARPDAGSWAASVQYPAQPRWQPVLSTDSIMSGTTDGYLGDTTMGLANVTAFEITPVGTGQIILATSPTDVSGFNQGFGMEPFIYRIDIAKMKTELTAASRLISTISLGASAADHSGTYYINPQTVNYSFSGLLDKTGNGMVSVHCESAYVNLIENQYITGETGTAKIGALAAGGKMTSHGSIFLYGDSLGLKVAIQDTGSSANPYTATFVVNVYKQIPGLVEVIGIHSDPALARSDDADRPETATANIASPVAFTVKVGRLKYPTGKFVQCNNVFYSAAYSRFVMAMSDKDNYRLGRGLWVYIHQYSPEARNLKIVLNADGLAYDYVGAIERLNDGVIAIASNSPTPPYYYGDNVTLQFFDIFEQGFISDSFTAALTDTGAGVCGIEYNTKENRLGFVTEFGFGTGNGGEMWFYTPPATDGEWHWSRDIRTWWDGTSPDLIMGAGGDSGGLLNQSWQFVNPSYTSSKGNTSNALTFSVSGFDYLPWNENSEFNASIEAPSVYDDGGLADGNRIILERGVWMNGEWVWIQEGTFFVLKSPAVLESGVSSMAVTTGGPISLLVTRGVYRGTHKPTEHIYTRVAMTSTDGLNWIYNDGVNDITDWTPKPPAKIYDNGVLTVAYTITTASGIVTFPVDMTGHTIEATFNAYEPGTNEAEDIILCILRYPQELGGCGLDDSYFMRLLYDETLTTSDYLTYSFSKNNVVDGDSYNAIYRDAVLQTEGVDYTADSRAGTVTFGGSQAGHAITGNAKYYTIQKSGATLRPITLKPKAQKNSYDCINEVCRRVAPNYIFREGRDGKLECDFFTQKVAADADVTIDTDSDIIISQLSVDPIYEGLATRVLSFGQAELQDLPNWCLGKTVTDEWPYGWHAGVDVQSVTDGDPNTGAHGGFGRAWESSTMTILQALIASGVDGIPVLSVDMGEPREVATIIVSRTSQAANEGDVGPGCIEQISVWVSNDGASWVRIVDATEIGPGQNMKFVAGTNYDEGTTFQYIRINFHTIGIYHNSKGDSDTQFSIGEIQCYPDTTIEGVAVLQDDDPTDAHYDSWGLLPKYGIINYVARGGEPDSMLYTQELADADAGFVLDEIVRLLDKVEIRVPWLPGIPVFSTIAIHDAAMGTTETYFVESRDAGPDGDVYTGTTLP